MSEFPALVFCYMSVPAKLFRILNAASLEEINKFKINTVPVYKKLRRLQLNSQDCGSGSGPIRMIFSDFTFNKFKYRYYLLKDSMIWIHPNEKLERINSKLYIDTQ